MGINFKFDHLQFRQAVAQKVAELDAAIVNRFTRVGEQFIADARESGGYKDQTGNLRSSIGYLLLKNGRVIAASYSRSSTGSGAQKGKEFLLKISEEYPSGYVLICAAGMEYAAAVESMGKDVITGSSQTAETSLKDSLAALFRKYNT
jgi:hypothetical protein